MCHHAAKWIQLIEARTDDPFDYHRAVMLYERLTLKSNDNDLRQIEADIPRTFPEEPFFKSTQSYGQSKLK
jgi:hypothetical protein